LCVTLATTTWTSRATGSAASGRTPVVRKTRHIDYQRRRRSMRISIFGLGYVGTVSLACLARDGHHVIGVDIDASKLAMLRDGRSPVIEAGMRELIAEVVASGRVEVTDDVAAAVHGSEL